MRYVIGIIAGVVLIMGAVGGMENDTLNITYSLKMMVIGVILIYECYIIRQKKRQFDQEIVAINFDSSEIKVKLIQLDTNIILWKNEI